MVECGIPAFGLPKEKALGASPMHQFHKRELVEDAFVPKNALV